jgi:hypothetical protein
MLPRRKKEETCGAWSQGRPDRHGADPARVRRAALDEPVVRSHVSIATQRKCRECLKHDRSELAEKSGRRDDFGRPFIVFGKGGLQPSAISDVSLLGQLQRLQEL